MLTRVREGGREGGREGRSETGRVGRELIWTACGSRRPLLPSLPPSLPPSLQRYVEVVLRETGEIHRLFMHQVRHDRAGRREGGKKEGKGGKS